MNYKTNTPKRKKQTLSVITCFILISVLISSIIPVSATETMQNGFTSDEFTSDEFTSDEFISDEFISDEFISVSYSDDKTDSVSDVSRDYVPGCIFVKYDPTLLRANSLSEDVIATFPDLVPGLQLIKLPEGVSVEDAVEYYENQPGVIYAEPNYYLESHTVIYGEGYYEYPESEEDFEYPESEEYYESVYSESTHSESGIVADDSVSGNLRENGMTPTSVFFQYQWGLQNTGQLIPRSNVIGNNSTTVFPTTNKTGNPGSDIRVSGAWNKTRGSKNLIVAVIDSGVFMSHPDISHAIYANPGEIPGNGIDDDGNGYIDDVNGWDFVSDDNDPSDEKGHGTHCAGVIAGSPDGHITGVAPNVTILPIRILSNSGGSIDSELKAIEYINKMGVRIASCSYSSNVFSNSEYDALKNSNILFVCAAGNDGSSSNNYPGNYDLPNIVCVSASDWNDSLASFSNYHQTNVDLSAPGACILSSYWSKTADNYVCWKTENGTSMATPHVSGAAALVLSSYPSLTASQVRVILTESADFIPAHVGKSVSSGRLNATAAMNAAQKAVAGTLEFSIRDYPETVNVSENDTITLYALVEGSKNGNLEYKWEKYSKSGWIESGGFYNWITLKAKPEHDNLIYRCTVTDRDTGESLTTGNMTLHVGHVAPTFVSIPENLSLNAGDDAVFSASATSPDGGNVTFVWQIKNGNTWKTISGKDVTTESDGIFTTVFTLQDISCVDDGIYRCVASNEKGSRPSSEVSLKVTRTISFRSDYGTVPKDIVVTGSTKTIQIPDEYPTYPGMTFLRWKNGNSTYLPGKKYSIPTSAVLEAVMAENLRPPTITAQPLSTSIPESASTVLRVNVTDVTYANTTFEWQYRQNENQEWKTIPNSSTNLSQKVKGNITEYSSSYKTGNAIYTNSNIHYRCVVKNLAGVTESNVAIVSVTRELKYETEHGTAPPATVIISPAETAVVTGKYPIATGYVFLNWKDGSATYVAGDTVTVRRGLTLEANMAPVNINFHTKPAENIEEFRNYLTNGGKAGSDTPEDIKNYDLDQNGLYDGRDLILLEKYVWDIYQ